MPKARRILLGLLLAVLLAVPAATQRAEPTIRVLVFNIHAGKDAGARRNLESVADLVRKADADIVLLQEVDRGTRRSGHVDQLKILAEATKYSAAFGRSLDYDGGQYGIAALARASISSHSTEALPVQPPQARSGGSYEPRAALAITTSTPLGTTVALNTHLDASRDDTYRLQEAAHIIVMVKRALSATRFVVAGGDFNTEPGSAAYQQLIDGGLKDAWTMCGKGEGFTYPADRPIKRIDYLFMTAGLRCTHAEVIDTRISDHRPILVTLAR